MIFLPDIPVCSMAVAEVNDQLTDYYISGKNYCFGALSPKKKKPFSTF
jgi:hypothetical protein